MKKIDLYNDYSPLITNKNSVKVYGRHNAVNSPDLNELENYVKAPSIEDYDIKLIIQKLNDLPQCFNEFLEEKMKEPEGPFQLLEIRKRNIKIKMHFSESYENNNIICSWCDKKCPKSETFKEKEINFARTNSKICCCGIKKHNISRQKSNLILNLDNKEEIDNIVSSIKDCTNEKAKKDLKQKFSDLIYKEENNKILQIFSDILNITEAYNFFYSFKYDDDLYSKIILPNIKESKNYSSFNNIMVSYINKYFFKELNFENPIYIFNLDFSDKNTAYALYYYNPDIFSYSFYFQVYRKNIITKNIESHEFISFLRELGVSNEVLCSHMMNDEKLVPELFSFGFFSLDSISKLNAKELTKYKQNLSYSNIILIQSNQFCEIFLDFIKNGESKSISLLDESNHFSKFFIEKIIDSMQSLIDDRKKNDVKEIKNILINYPLFKFHFYEENKQRILAFLSSYAYSISENQNIFKDCDTYEKIFELIKNKIETIVKQGILRKKDDSQQNILIVKKVLDLYNLKYKFKNLYLYDFNNLLQNIIGNNYPIKLADEALKIISSLFHNSEEVKLLDSYLKYLLNITLICCINIIGGSYIYNSNFIPKILQIIKKLNFNEHSHFILEMLTILKKCFNRQIIDISFLCMRNDDEEITLKEYLIDILFRNDPIISNESMYNFDIFNRLLNRISTIYSFIFEKKNNHILPNSFVDINFEDSYLDIIKSIISNMNEEFCQMHWKNENKNLNFESYEKKEKLIDANEKQLEKKISEEVKKITKRLPGFILLDFLRCLENLNQTNFYLKYDECSFLIDDKFDLISIIIEDKVPLAIKSLILNYLLKLVLSLKFEPINNKIYFPLAYTSSLEEEANEFQVKDSTLITKESNESEKHLNESIKLINIFIICIELLKKQKEKEKFLNFKKAFIEKNGLYDFCVSIIHGLYYFSNLIINTNKIHDLYMSVYIKFAHKFFENKDIFMDIINYKEKDNDIFKTCNGRMEMVVKINKTIQKYVNKISSDLYNYSERNLTNIYQNYIDFHKGNLSISTNNHYNFVLNKKDNEEITIDELNEFNGLDSKINSKISNNYNEWINYINEQSPKIKILFEKILDTKRASSNKRKFFYLFILLAISDVNSTCQYILNDHLFLKALIRIIRSDQKFKSVCDDEKMKLAIKDYIKNQENDYENIKARIIGSIIRKIYFLTNYELSVSKCFSNTKQENDLSELLNSLILFFEVLGENFNPFFHDAIFKYKFDFSAEKSNNPVEKYDEESKTFKILNEKANSKNIYSPFEVLLELHKKIFESLRITPDKNFYRETQQNNLLIIFNSLTYCIIEYSNFEDPDYSSILNKLYFQYFYWKREDKSFNPIFQALNFEIYDDILHKTKYIFEIYNILSLFVFYLRYGTKEKNKNYFYQIRNYPHYTPNIYLFHTYKYTFEIINHFDENILKDKESIRKIIDLYKKEKFRDIGLFRIAQKYFEIINIAKQLYGFFELKFVFPDYDEKNVDSNRILEYLADSGNYSVLINDVIVNNDSLDESAKMSEFKNYSKTMDIIFSFWRKIFKNIEVSINDKKQIIYYILTPENLYISDFEKLYYEDIIDYSSRDSRLMSLYENIDSYVFEMISNSCNQRFNFVKIFYYYGLELINILLFVIHNIILLILYYKSWKNDYSKYNEIENDKTSIYLYIFPGIHILYIIIIIINWFINILYIDYYYSLSQYSKDTLKPKDYISRLRDDFPSLREKLMGNYSTIFSAINEFFPKLKEEYIYILIVKTIILNPKVYPFIISLICLILHFLVSQIFLVIPLLLLAKLIPTLSAIFIGLFSKFKYLIFVYIYTLLVLYIFSWIAFLFLPRLFKHEVVDKYNEYLVDDYQQLIEENICSSSIQCFLYFLNYGLSSGGTFDLNLISFKDNYGYYLRQFFFDIFLFLLINMIFSNVFLALITDAFTEMRELAWKKENDKVNVCFICDLDKSDSISQNIRFNRHIEEHFKWKYINFMSKLILNADVEFNNEEYYIWNLMKKRSIDWFPKKD